VAGEIAKILRCNQRANGYYHGGETGNYYITWAFGHLLELASPEAYGYSKKWSLEQLPMIPKEFKLAVRQKKEKGIIKNDEGVEKQLSIIETLFNKSESIIVATDAGREGELIFRFIYQYLNCKKPFERLWISSLTDEAIKKGFENLRPGKEYDSLFYSAKARSESDWLVGLNSTQAFTLVAGQGLLSLGRVQTPTLALICKRYIDNTSFQSKTYCIVKASFYSLEKRENCFETILVDDENKNIQFEKKEAATELILKLQSAGRIRELKEKTIEEPPPLLYDLSALQQDGNKRNGLSADQGRRIKNSLVIHNVERKKIKVDK
jgi:DNA topoisomerase-3